MKKGFTLVELLAVIVILAIILVIAIPKILDVIRVSKIKTLENSARIIAKMAEEEKLDHDIFGNTNNFSCTDIAEYNKKDYGSCILSFNNGEATVKLKGKKGGKFEGLQCVGTKNDMNCGEIVIPANNCTYDGELVQGAEYVNGQYTYRYKQEDIGTNWSNINIDGWGVTLTNKNSTDPITTELCTSINNKPIVSMLGMFSNSQATSIDLSSFDTSKVTNMSFMFSTSKGTPLDLSNFDTSNVTDMSYMFSNNRAPSLDLSSFDTSKVTNMMGMFRGSSVLEINLSSFDTSNVTSMSNMFGESQITTLDLSSFNMSNVTSTSNMFLNTSATTGYARTQADADILNASSNIPATLTFVVKP